MAKDMDSVSENTVLDIADRKSDGTGENYIVRSLIVGSVSRVIN